MAITHCHTFRELAPRLGRRTRRRTAPAGAASPWNTAPTFPPRCRRRSGRPMPKDDPAPMFPIRVDERMVDSFGFRTTREE